MQNVSLLGKKITPQRERAEARTLLFRGGSLRHSSASLVLKLSELVFEYAQGTRLIFPAAPHFPLLLNNKMVVPFMIISSCTVHPVL